MLLQVIALIENTSMKNEELYTKLAYETSEKVTRTYSTSFSAAILLLNKPLRKHIYAIYGLVRLADEIVDSFRPENMLEELNNLEMEVYTAIKSGFSSNLLVHSFALTAKKFTFNESEISAFFTSMQTDVLKAAYSRDQYEKYIYGSAEVIGLMSTRVFCADDSASFNELNTSAKALGSAFQKINFLRDINADHELGRVYFPNVNFELFTNQDKSKIIKDIKTDLRISRRGLLQLPHTSKYGVLLALYYYEALLHKLQSTPSQQLLQNRIRVSNAKKLWLYIIVRIQKISRS